MADTARIDALRKIVAECTAATVEGQVVDLFTASAMVAVYDALSPANQERFGSAPFMQLVTFCLSKITN